MSTPDQHGRSYEVWRVAPDTVQMMWPQVKPILDEYGEEFYHMTAEEDVIKYLMEDKLELWIGMGPDGAVQHVGITQVCGRVNPYVEILFVAGAGAIRFLVPALKKLEQWAATIGAKSIVAGGTRMGWTRLLYPLGYRIHRVEVKKDISFIRDDANEPVWRQ